MLCVVYSSLRLSLVLQNIWLSGATLPSVPLSLRRGLGVGVGGPRCGVPWAGGVFCAGGPLVRRRRGCLCRARRAAPTRLRRGLGPSRLPYGVGARWRRRGLPGGLGPPRSPRVPATHAHKPRAPTPALTGRSAPSDCAAAASGFLSSRHFSPTGRRTASPLGGRSAALGSRSPVHRLLPS